MKKAVVLVSGGLDSCVTAAVAKDLGYNLCLLHVNYGQLTEKRELRAFNDIAEYYKVKEKLIVDISYLKDIGGSALTDEKIDVEEGSLNRVGIPKTYVPFRNANILSIATSWAEVIACEKIFIGAVEEDSSGYPDCRKVFYEAFNNLLKVGVNPENNIEVITPLIELKKKDIVLLGKKLNAPLHLTWSCYKSEDLACGNCDSCFLRLRGFKEANIKDPIPYSSFPEFYDII
ncbi:MAG: transcriptional regulator, ExsB family [Deferribacteraceae bacterium]|jgi:7-cyano-7-deazaguanine synthase|nr:transcriptional regulator, ExsB family [Deferribacteraceae bacterium]